MSVLNQEINIRNKIALVTGGSRGIGRAIAISLAKIGITVVINYKSNSIEAKKTVNELKNYSNRCISISADVSQANEVSELINTVINQFGSIDILVNNAAIAKTKDLDTITENDWDETININLKSVFLVTQAVIPSMKNNKWGRIINISSTAVQLGGIIGPHYTASKAGIIGLTHAYASQLVADNITVNTIAPALIETDMIKNNSKANPNRIPVGRFGTTDEVAQVASMLITNGYITGQTININGGLYYT